MPFDPAFVFENRATRDPFSCRNASCLQKTNADLIGRSLKLMLERRGASTHTRAVYKFTGFHAS